MELIIKKFNELEASELYEILKARYEVFTVGQRCLYQDCDDKDKESYHLYLREGNRVVAYLRILEKGIAYDEVSIGRVLVVESHRRKGLALKIMKEALKFIQFELQEEKIKISAQEYLVNFYGSLGFKKVSDTYIEAGMEHVKMVYENTINKNININKREKVESVRGVNKKLSIYATLGIALITVIGFHAYQNIFTTGKWIESPSNRNKIVFDLFKKYDLIGMKEKDIINLLGEEQGYEKEKTSFKINRSYFPPEDTIVYYLGVDYMDDMWLVISLDNGVVIDYLIDLSWFAKD